MSRWRSRAAAAALGAALAGAAPAVATACAVSYPLPPEVLAADAVIEGQAWRDAPLVYLARVTAAGPRWDYFELTPVRVLKGAASPPVINMPPVPSRGECVIYHGLNVADGASVGDEFVVYAFTVPPTARSRTLVVSARMLGDPATRRALEAARRRSGR